MNRYLLSAAALALMAAPAFAQHEHGHGGGPGGGGPQGAPAAQPAAPAAAPAPGAPHAGGGGSRGDFHSGGRPGGDFHHDAQRPAAPAPAAVQQTPSAVGNGPGRGDFRRDNDNRNDVRHDNRPDNRPGFNSNNRPSFGPAGRPMPGGQGGYRSNNGGRNFSGFRDFHRAISAPHRFRGPSYRQPPGFAYRRWSFGEILPSLYWGQQYWLSDYNSYDLPPPPYGAVWVRYGSDALLIDRDSGGIITVYYGVFY